MKIQQTSVQMGSQKKDFDEKCSASDMDTQRWFKWGREECMNSVNERYYSNYLHTGLHFKSIHF